MCLPISGADLLILVEAVVPPLAIALGATFCLPISGADLLIRVEAVVPRLTIALGAMPFFRASVQSGICPAYGAENQHTNQTCQCYS